MALGGFFEPLLANGLGAAHLFPEVIVMRIFRWTLAVANADYVGRIERGNF